MLDFELLTKLKPPNSEKNTKKKTNRSWRVLIRTKKEVFDAVTPISKCGFSVHF